MLRATSMWCTAPYFTHTSCNMNVVYTEAFWPLYGSPSAASIQVSSVLQGQHPLAEIILDIGTMNYLCFVLAASDGNEWDIGSNQAYLFYWIIFVGHSVIYGLFHCLFSTGNFCLGPIEDDLGFGCGAVKHGAQHAAVFLTEFSILSWRLLCFLLCLHSGAFQASMLCCDYIPDECPAMMLHALPSWWMSYSDVCMSSLPSVLETVFMQYASMLPDAWCMVYSSMHLPYCVCLTV